MSHPTFRAVFSIPRLIRERMGTAPDPARLGDGADPWFASVEELDATFAGLDALVVALVLAGYDVPQLVAVDSSTTSSFVQASLIDTTAAVEEGSWADATQITDVGDFETFIALRVLAWRNVGDRLIVPVVLPADKLTFRAWKDPTDLASDPADGWVIIGSPTEGSSFKDIATTYAETARSAVVDAIVDGYKRTAAGADPPGLVRLLNPAGWSAPRERGATVQPLREIGDAIWAGLSGWRELDAFLRYRLDDHAARPAKLLAVSGVEVDYSIGDVEGALDWRRQLLHPTDVQLPTIIAGLSKAHWLLALMQLHEYGLVRVLPPPAYRAPAIPVLDLTGWYESLTDPNPTFSVIATVQINQAGDHLFGFWFDEQLYRYDFTGIRSAGAALAFDITSSDGVPGHISFDATPACDPERLGFYATWQGYQTTWVMARRDRKARLHPDTIAEAIGWTSAVPLSALTSPLHSLHTSRIYFLVSDVVPRVEADWVDGFDAHNLDQFVAEYVIEKKLAPGSDTGSGLNRWQIDVAEPTPLVHRLRFELRRRFSDYSISVLNPPDPLDGWRAFVGYSDVYRANCPQIRALIDVVDPHDYDLVDLKGIGLEGEATWIAGIHAGYYGIETTIQHSAECQAPSDKLPRWLHYYVGHMVTGGGALGLEADATLNYSFAVTDPDSVTTDSEWAPEDFLCQFVVGGGKAGFGIYDGGGATPGFGRESIVMYATDGRIATGLNWGGAVEFGWGLGGGVGGNLTGSWGAFTAIVTDPNHPPPSLPTAVPANEVLGLEGNVTYFAVDSSTLTTDGEKDLADLVARYRALLEDPGSYVLVEGDASRTDTEEYNYPLSRDRALAVYAWIRALLACPPLSGCSEAEGVFPESTAFSVPDGHVRIRPHGELQAEAAGQLDEVEDDAWRMATLSIGGRSLLFMGPPAGWPLPQ